LFFKPQQTFGINSNEPMFITTADLNRMEARCARAPTRSEHPGGIPRNGTEPSRLQDFRLRREPFWARPPDVNADGKLGSHGANEGPSNLGSFFGNGDGTFQAQQTFSTGAGTAPASVAVADVNGDGKPDLIVAD